jgi:hypothetical protein
MAVFKWSLVLLIGLLFCSTGFSVTTTFVSSDDDDITLKSVLVSMGKDNLQTIYSRPLSEHLVNLLQRDQFLETTETLLKDAVELDELRAQPKKVTDLLSKASVDGLLHLQIAKGQMGLRFELGLFTRKSGLLWAYVDFLEKEKFDLDHGREIVRRLYSQLIGQIPYQGLLLSRTGSKVTINRGSLAGITPDQEIEIIQVVAVQRHPQFGFVTHVQKEILGKIRILKADDTLSFGYILFEKEPQSLQTGLKLLLREPVYYSDLATSKNEAIVDHLMARGDGNVIMQGDSKEWLPQDRPTFGRAHLLFGTGQFGATTNLAVDGGQQGSTLLAINAQVDADLWITRTWFLRAGLNQGSAQFANPLSNSSPDKLNFALQGLNVAAGYDLEISSDLHGPRLQCLIGYSQFSATATESTPTSFTSTVFNGMGLGLTGYMPWDEYQSKWGFGAELWYHFFPSVTETPVSSGSPENPKIIELSGSTFYHWRPNIYWMAKLSLSSFNTSFSGSGTRIQSATSSDFSWTRLNGGIEFLF